MAGEFEAPVRVLTVAEHVDKIRFYGERLAGALTDATEAGVSQALILPQLVLIFRTNFGAIPPGISIPGVTE